jgi:hypothetical protein
MTLVAHPSRRPAWEVLGQAVTQRRSVRARYHGHDRIICPHLLAWRHGRIVALVYQTGGSSSSGPMPADPRNRWRSLFLDEIEDASIADERWQTASNYNPDSSFFDSIIVAVDLK